LLPYRDAGCFVTVPRYRVVCYRTAIQRCFVTVKNGKLLSTVEEIPVTLDVDVYATVLSKPAN